MDEISTKYKILIVVSVILCIIFGYLIISSGGLNTKTPAVRYKVFDILPLPISDNNSSIEHSKIYLYKVSDGKYTAYKLFIDINEKDNSLVLPGNEVEIEFITTGETPYIECYKGEESHIDYYGLMTRRSTTDYYYYKIHIPQGSVMKYNY